MPDIVMTPIGVVRRAPSVPAESGQYVDPRADATIEIDPQWEPGLTGIEEYSHLVVLFALDRAPRRDPATQTQHPEGREDLPRVGFFATRATSRPNPIAITCPRLLRRDGNRLVVEGIDAWDGSPVLDIKGYTPRDEMRPDAQVPAWLSHLWALHDAERG
jgi:tRNA-Thr(GGU) m(6)t(6)A37 methyltransferase TsaA